MGMARGPIQSLLAFVLLAVALCPSAHADPQIVPMVRIETAVDVAAPASEVWSYMTTGKNLVTWCSYWKNETNSDIQLDEVGDVLEFLDSWDNGGRSVVTYLDPRREIRVAHEPTNGSYLCQARFRLEPIADGTRVTYVEHYTDESPPKERAATAKTMRAEMLGSLDELKRRVEGK